MTTLGATLAFGRVDFGKAVLVVDPLRRRHPAADYTLTIAPIIVDGVPDALVERRRRTRSKPFPGEATFSGRSRSRCLA